MKKLKRLIATFLGLCFLVLGSLLCFEDSYAQGQVPSCTTEYPIMGIIGAGTADGFERALKKSVAEGCSSMLVLIDTPGGNLFSTRKIVEQIINAPVPVLCLVHPSGAHAGSAGAIILLACHVSGAMVATNIGAATPISGVGEQLPEDLRKKILNDARSWLEAITRLRGRNEQFGRDIIMEAKAVEAREAQKIGAIDVVTTSKEEFLKFAQGREVKMSEDKKERVAVGTLRLIKPDLRQKVLEWTADPEVAYLLFMGSLALLYFEITHPGFGAPGVIGGIGLILSLISLHKLDVAWGGVALILLGIAFMIAEAFVASFGILGAGGVVALVLGSILMFDTKATGFALPLDLILPTALGLGLITLGLASLAFRTRQVKRRGTFDDLVGIEGKIVELDEDQKSGYLEANGELWKFHSDQIVKINQGVQIKGHRGLVLDVGLKKES